MLARWIFLATAAIAMPRIAAAANVAVAAAANLTYVVADLKAEFARIAPDVNVTVTLGSSGGLYAQITHGAPFDVLLSADTDYPRRLVAAQAGVAESRFNFATGRLALWTTRKNLELRDVADAVRAEVVGKIAIAQPDTAPYGRAALSVLRHLGVWEAAQPKLVIGENIAQTAQFVETGNADCGFVALSLLLSGRLADVGRWIEVPPDLYRDVPLEHAAVITTHGKDNAAAHAFVTFLRSAAARRILVANGYRVP